MAGAGTLYDVAIVGAGAAGLAAAKTADACGLASIVLEASHRIGGRAYTEELAPGIAFDLGCHWMHSASLNPFVAIADRFGFTYRKGGYPHGFWRRGRCATEEERASYTAFAQRNDAAVIAAAGAGLSVADVTEREDAWTPLFDYWASLLLSVDPDQVAVEDLINYRDTDENWPLKEGYGALIARFGADVPVSLNCAVQRLDWTGPAIALHTAKGTVRAKRALITVSTGILGNGDIRFDPALPDWKLTAIADLPLGTHNRIGLLFDRDVFGPSGPTDMTCVLLDDEPVAFGVRPFGQNYAVAYTGGRHAAWLERAGTAASVDFAKEKLAKLFGSEITKHVARHIATAWAGDPWTRGAYSAALPGRNAQRAELARPLDGRLFFAGEATSTDFYSTAHGAYLTGIDAMRMVAESLGRTIAADAPAFT